MTPYTLSSLFDMFGQRVLLEVLLENPDLFEKLDVLTDFEKPGDMGHAVHFHDCFRQC